MQIKNTPFLFLCTKFWLALMLVCIFQITCTTPEIEPRVDAGVPQQLAQARKSRLNNIRYQLHFDIPANKEQAIQASAHILFTLNQKSGTSLVLDFKEDSQKIKTILVNDKKVPKVFENEHIFIAPQFLKLGENSVKMEFQAGESALNRKDNFLYTLFVPDRARTVFPCFDQPDLKARFSLTLSIPTNWQALANGKLIDSSFHHGRKTLTFAASEPLSTYLFSFAAGDFKVAIEPWRNQEITLLYRETDAEKINTSLPQIFEEYKAAVVFNEHWTGLAYPFQKHGMVAIPDFQFGGMEHPGAILLQSATLFLGKDATEGQKNNRSQLLAHEVAHMWFGDLVTMDWFSDVWIKEVFANFIADKANTKANHKKGFELKFLTDHIPPAYAVDRSLGSHPIQQPLDNLNNAGMLYGNIIYHKAPIMMRQLEAMMGSVAFQKGVQTYLKKYAYGNASWPNLIHILDQFTHHDLESWNTVWVNTAGRPVFKDSIDITANKISNFYLFQTPEVGKERIWPQRFDVGFYYKNMMRSFWVNMDRNQQLEPQALDRRKPLFLQYNLTGMGYGVWPIDSNMIAKIFSIEDYVARASAYINLYENMLMGRYISPERTLDLFLSGLNQEKTELNLRLLTSYIQTIFWNFIAPEKRKGLSVKMEEGIWKAMMQHSVTNNKKILFNCYQQVFISIPAQKKLFSIWKNQSPPAQVILKEDDYTDLAFELALRDSTEEAILSEQATRISNPDRIKRFKIIRPALSFQENIRDQFFSQLGKKQHRSNESAVGRALYYLHHPLRQPSAEKYLPATLEMLPEIQKTGDIFFPTNWLQNSFGRYQSPTAYRMVTHFLEQAQNLNPNLKGKVLQATDLLRRSQTLVQ